MARHPARDKDIERGTQFLSWARRMRPDDPDIATAISEAGLAAATLSGRDGGGGMAATAAATEAACEV